MGQTKSQRATNSPYARERSRASSSISIGKATKASEEVGERQDQANVSREKQDQANSGARQEGFNSREQGNIEHEVNPALVHVNSPGLLNQGLMKYPQL